MMSLLALDAPRSLLTLIGELPTDAWTWPYVDAQARDVAATLPCHPRVIDAGEMSEEDVEAFEQAIRAAGLKCFLSADQLVDVVSNLRAQRPDAMPGEVVAAVDFYWKHDAFIAVETGATSTVVMPPEVTHPLDDAAFAATFAAPMRDVTRVATDVIDVWPYVASVRASDLRGHTIYDQFVEYVYRDATGRFDHVLVMTRTKNVYLAVVVDLALDRIHGHHLLDLNELYGVATPGQG